MSIVQQGMKYLDDIKDDGVKLQLIIVLREVTSGKIFLEIENARLTKMYSLMKETQGN